MHKIGTLKKQNSVQYGEYEAFIPDKFPPEKGFEISADTQLKASEATLSLGKLDGITELLPDVDFFIFMYIRKDAASSSQIEGTMATMINAIEAESKTTEKLPDDVDDIIHYINALNYGLKRLGDIPLSLRLIKEVHKQLMEGARSSHFSNPGEFRSSQNWIGGISPSNARFVPPPVKEMKDSLYDLEDFLHAESNLAPLIKIAIIHSQFETIHPFLDGNGRTGRMLIPLYLSIQKLLERPVLFLSTYFKDHQQLYYERLDGYHNGEVDNWIEFFLDGIIEVSKEAIDIVKKITKLRERDIIKIQELGKTSAKSTLKVIPHLYKLPIVNVPKIQEWTGFTRQGAQKVIERLAKLDILKQKDESITYGRSFIYKEYVDIFVD